jgi:galactose mutarotase-like enzyme
LFKEGALVFDSLQSRWVRYQSRSGRGVTVEFEGFPYLGLWSKPGVPFVCIEPWFGIADRVGADWDLADKPGVIRLSANQEFNCRHHIRFD